jgi:DNA-binding winged helix-turn-helix (wHTH) protein/Tol biopolymer transport system component
MLDFAESKSPATINRTGTVRFATFEADLHAGEIRKAGVRVKLQEQPFKVLQILLEQPGKLVTREELQSRIWPEESYGDFDHAVNVAVGKLRTALGDSADNPRFVETIPRRGYRFVAAIEECAIEVVPARPSSASDPTVEGRARRRWVLQAVCAVVVAAALVALGALLGRHTIHEQAPYFQRITVMYGTVYSARFAPDGNTIIYAASWDGAPIEIFATDAKRPGSRRLGLQETSLLAVSSTGELAVQQSPSPRFMMTLRGTLSQVPLTGGSPRQIAENVDWADWAPDGKTLAVVRETAGSQRLEFPQGHVIYETTGWVSHPRVSPKGDLVAFLDHPNPSDDRGVVSVVDLAGHKRVLSTGWESEEGLAWSPRGNKVWFTATVAGLQRQLYTVDLSGNVHLSFRGPGGVTLLDIAPDGRLLLTRDEHRTGIMGMAAGATRERDLSWRDWSLPTDLSPDGKWVVFDEEGEQAGPTYTVAMRDLLGSPPVPLGEGMSGGISSDGKWVAATVDYTQIVLLPTGPGTSRKIERGGIQQYGHPVRWLPDGKRILFAGSLPGRPARCFIQNIDDGHPRPVTPEGITACFVSPDGKRVAAKDSVTNQTLLYPIDGGQPEPIPGLLPGEAFDWTPDPKFLYVHQWRRPPVRVYRLNLATGQRQLFKELTPSDIKGVCDMPKIRFSADGRSYIYGYTRLLSDLYLVSGLR